MGGAKRPEKRQERAAPKPSKVIRVWRFYEAPSHLRALSQHGGDEDWLAHVPKHFAEVDIGPPGTRPHPYIGWLQSSTPFGVCDVTEHDMPDGSKVYIGAHA